MGRLPFPKGSWPTVVVACVVLACRATPETPSTDPDEQADLDEAPAEEPLIMPAYPAAGRTRLAAVGVGAHEFAGSWEVRGGRCDDPHLVQLLTDDPTVGVLILVRLPQGDVPERFPVLADSVFPPATARLAVRVSRGRSAFAYAGVEGEVEMARAGERVSGKFTVTLREIAMETTTLAAGAFRDVEIGPLPDEECAMARAAWVEPDSAASRSD